MNSDSKKGENDTDTTKEISKYHEKLNFLNRKRRLNSRIFNTYSQATLEAGLW